MGEEDVAPAGDAQKVLEEFLHSAEAGLGTGTAVVGRGDAPGQQPLQLGGFHPGHAQFTRQVS